MNRRKVITALTVYSILHLFFWPTYEVDRGFEEIALVKNKLKVTIRLDGNYNESRSRILNLVTNGSPYCLQIFVKQGKLKYDWVQFESITLNDPVTNITQTISTNQYIGTFHKSSSSAYEFASFPKVNIPSDLGGNLVLSHRDYVINVKLKVCNNKTCKNIKIEEPLKYREKRKFYSNTFANMMGI